MNERPRSHIAATICGVPVFIHLSTPFGGLVFYGFAGSGAGLIELAYYCIAAVLVVVVHTAGHFAAVRSLRLAVFAVYFSAIHGKCATQSACAVRDMLYLSAGGILAQFVLLLLTLLFIEVFDLPTSVLGRSIVNTFTFYNGVLLLVNAIPWKTRSGLKNDGFVLWQVVIAALKKP